MRKDYEISDWGQTTPRAKQKPNIPVDINRRSTTPSRLKERVSNSPLRVPLQKAIYKVAKDREKSTNKSRQSRLDHSSRREDSSIISMARKIYYDEEPEKQKLKAHSQTYNFLKKYFTSNVKQIPLEIFIRRLMQEYESLWGTQNVDKILDDFAYKIEDIFGEVIDIRELIRATREDGMIGLILRVFKQIKNEENTRNSNYTSFSQNPQVMSINRSFQDRLNENSNISGIKNVVQEFMQTMYQCMENEIYNRFNIEMKRMVVKYREAERLLKKVNEKLTTYADVFDLEKKMKEKEKKYQERIAELKKENEKINMEMTRQKDNSWNQKRQKDRLLEQNKKLKQNLQKYQNIVLNRALENISDQNNSRQNANNSRILERCPNENMMGSQLSQNPSQPFKITIDTHFVQRDQGPPETKTYTTLHNPPTVPTPRRNSYENNIPLPILANNLSGSTIVHNRGYSPHQSRTTKQ